MSVKDKKPIYVVGFPKSGNTWLARLLAESTMSNIKATNLRDASDNSSDRDGDYVIYKIHDDSKYQLSSDAQIIYIVRDVRDALVSAFFFNNKFVREDWVKLKRSNRKLVSIFARAYFRHQIRRMSKCWCGNEFSVLMNWIKGNKNKLGSWSEHIASWTLHENVVVIRYEDLLYDTYAEMDKLLHKLKIDVSEERLQEAVSNQMFKKKKSKFINSGDSKNVKFLRSGKSGEFGNFLSPVLVKEIEKTHAHAMSKYGYKFDYHEDEE